MFEDLEDSSSLFQQIKKHFSVRLTTQVLVFLSGLIISSFGLYQLYDNNVHASNENLDDSAQVCEKDPEFGRLTVDIGGAVKNPGIYELSVGSRMNDLINLAGGFTHSVDKYYINKVLNLSQHISDGEKFYIPTLEESLESQEKQLSNSSSSSSSSATGVISINFAVKSDLMNLVGIGEKRAEDIIAGRPYESVNQLLEKGIITESVFEKIKNDLSL